MRRGVSTPVLILTARGDVDDRVRGLEGGADYYLSKPFQTPELIACLRAITRRKSDKPLMRLCFGDIELQQESVSLLCAHGAEREAGREGISAVGAVSAQPAAGAAA